MNDKVIDAVKRRAGHACEYCRLPDTVHPGTFELEHIIARQHSGDESLANLAYSCLRCNRKKGPNIAGLAGHGPRRKLVPLFNPRRHIWRVHFRFDGAIVIGRTAIGRVTVEVLGMNEPVRLALRESLIAEGKFPPK